VDLKYVLSEVETDGCKHGGRSWVGICALGIRPNEEGASIPLTCAVRHPPLIEVTSPTEAPMATKTRTGARASRTRAPNPARPPVTRPVDRFYAGKVTVERTRVDVPMLVLRGEWLKAIGFPIGAKAFLSTDKRGDITLTRMGLVRPRKLRVLKAKQ
jgi:hypothetical protein